jgi:hypothetical protein
MQSSISRTVVLMGVVVGVALVLLGMAARVVAPEREFVFDDELWQDRDDGTVTIYDHIETDLVYESVTPIDESTSAVYAFDKESGIRTEVFRGSPEEAYDFFETQTKAVVFEGTRAEAKAWVESQPDPGKDVMPSNVVIVAGVATIVIVLVSGRVHAPRQLVYGVIGAAMGMLPGVVQVVFVESPIIERQEELSYGEAGFLIAFSGVLLGGGIGALVGELSVRSQPGQSLAP